jgi:hypothetical protein
MYLEHSMVVHMQPEAFERACYSALLHQNFHFFDDYAAAQSLGGPLDTVVLVFVIQ